MARRNKIRPIKVLPAQGVFGGKELPTLPVSPKVYRAYMDADTEHEKLAIYMAAGSAFGRLAYAMDDLKKNVKNILHKP